MSVSIIETAIPPALCRAAEAAWPASDWQYWHRYYGQTAYKFGSMDRCRIPAACLAALDALALAVAHYIGESFIDYDLHAAGMHMLPPGGFLGRHLDAECHPIRPWRRTHSIVLFVNTRWNPQWGGQLMFDCGPSITPVQNEAVIFPTENMWHEVRPVEEFAHYRKTLALFAWKYDSECTGTNAAMFREGK